jgi:hypothetical protein
MLTWKCSLDKVMAIAEEFPVQAGDTLTKELPDFMKDVPHFQLHSTILFRWQVFARGVVLRSLCPAVALFSRLSVS